jgi:hypothetical protein
MMQHFYFIDGLILVGLTWFLTYSYHLWREALVRAFSPDSTLELRLKEFHRRGH